MLKKQVPVSGVRFGCSQLKVRLLRWFGCRCPHAAPLWAASLAQENIEFYRLFPEQKPAGKAEMAFATGFCYTEQFKLPQDLAAVLYRYAAIRATGQAGFGADSLLFSPRCIGNTVLIGGTCVSAELEINPEMRLYYINSINIHADFH